MTKEWFRADQPTMLSEYLYSIGYDTKDGITYKRGNSKVTIHKDCPVKEAKQAILNKQVKITGDPISFVQRITGVEVRKW